MWNSYNFQRYQTSDGVELCGLLSINPSHSKKAVLHIHGLAGNFYEQLFLDNLSKAAQNSDYRFMCFNNRGHDYISDAYRIKDGERDTFDAGGAHERIPDALYDINASVNLLKNNGCTEIVLSSHSTGCIKAALYLANEPDSCVTRSIFISPSDDVAIQMASKEAEFDSLLTAAKQLIDGGRGDELMSPDTFFYPIDAFAYVDLFDPKSAGNVFDIQNVANGLDVLRSITVPTHIIFGSEDIAVVGDKEESAKLILSHLGAQDVSDWKIIADADHSYNGKEAELGAHFADLLQ